MCKVSGSGIEAAVARVSTSFQIEGYTAAGSKCTEGGDHFVVHIRGNGMKTRAKVADLSDGTYDVTYKPQQSGSFSIAISLDGEQLPGSPFACIAVTPTPEVTKCIVRGPSLSEAVARVPQSFEVQFKDALGHVAHAEDLDVYVEADDPVEADPVPLIEWFRCNGDLEMVITSKVPLIVRAAPELDSSKVGSLRPGRRIYLHEVQEINPGGDVRALAAVDIEEEEREHTAKDDVWWRETHLTRPAWLIEKETEAPIGSPQNPYPVGASPRKPRSPRVHLVRGKVGWVTVTKDSRRLVAAHGQLPAGERQGHMAMWSRRQAVEKSAQTRRDTKAKRRHHHHDGHHGKVEIEEHTNPLGIFKNEISSDPSGIGFAFGGVEPGRLHAKGKPIETHKVSYSICLAGRYKLHVSLRQQGLPLPGSPYKLVVGPGPASAFSSALPDDLLLPLVGLVGNASDKKKNHGCHITLHTYDSMGNKCVAGGGAVKCGCSNIQADGEGAANAVERTVEDLGDGTYVLSWTSEIAGTFQASVTIGDDHVRGSPFLMKLFSDEPELSKSTLTGEGLETGIAGKHSEIRITFVDQYSNMAVPNAKTFIFGMSISKEKSKLEAAKLNAEFEGKWEEGGTGCFLIRYMPTQAGNNELHAWCDPSSKGERVALPGSPFHVHVSSGDASEEVSCVDSWSKLIKEDKNDKYGSQKAFDTDTLYASDSVCFRPQFFDQFGNPSTPPDGALRVVHGSPDGSEEELSYTTQVRAGVTSYDIRHDTIKAGEHLVNILLNGLPIKGSPVPFSVEPDKPDPPTCKLFGPDSKVLYLNQPYSCLLKTCDKFGNDCTVGGLQLANRLMVIKQSVNDQTTLVPSNHTFGWEDLGDGTYSITVVLKITCALRLFVDIDKNLPGQSGELPPVLLTFVPTPEDADAAKAAQEGSNREAGGADAKDKRRGSGSGE